MSHARNKNRAHTVSHQTSKTTNGNKHFCKAQCDQDSENPIKALEPQQYLRKQPRRSTGKEHDQEHPKRSETQETITVNCSLQMLNVAAITSDDTLHAGYGWPNGSM